MKRKIPIFAALCLTAAILIWNFRDYQSPSRVKTIQRLVKISAALESYQKDNEGSLPLTFSDLVPNYIQLEHASVFFDDKSFDRMRRGDRYEQDLRAVLIDNFSSFVYLRKNFGKGAQAILAYELFPRSMDPSDPAARAVLLSDFRARWMSEKEFQERLHNSGEE